ncbi:hypothetical protein Tcan_18677 [Toxocara canis]|uniref:Uncharacterized protein n=1 Tax=Toxocara canis TaxID=6265 RepID=A0A0B2V872_TOXCA|nr:hypothetical protein Tcan_18677 [Toxocara canis]
MRNTLAVRNIWLIVTLLEISGGLPLFKKPSDIDDRADALADLADVLRKMENRRTEHIFGIDDPLFFSTNSQSISGPSQNNMRWAKSMNRNCFFSITNCVRLPISSPQTNRRYQQYVEGMQILVDDLPTSLPLKKHYIFGDRQHS